MNSARAGCITALLILSPQLGSTQDLTRYRDYALESSLGSVIAASRARVADVKTLHERPAKIQELEWRAPYASSTDPVADPVRGIVFAFCDDALYQLVVTYDRDRTKGLTDGEIIESLNALYGDPVLRSARNRPPAALPDAVVLAQWDSAASSLTLLRDAYSMEFQLVLVSKALNTRARTAIREAGRLDAIEAPRRELEERRRQAADAAGARDKIRETNRAAFHP